MIKKFIAFALSVILINTQGSNAQETDSFQVFSKYDFIPGEKVIFLKISVSKPSVISRLDGIPMEVAKS